LFDESAVHGPAKWIDGLKPVTRTGPSHAENVRRESWIVHAKTNPNWCLELSQTLPDTFPAGRLPEACPVNTSGNATLARNGDSPRRRSSNSANRNHGLENQRESGLAIESHIKRVE
jgi:hypothetical protein